MALPAGTSGWLMPRNVPLPEKPENWSDDEAAELFENVLARYIWRHMHVSTRAQISLPVWKECFSMAVECNWVKVISLFEAVFNEWQQSNEFVYNPPTCFDSERMYYMAMEKRRYRRKSPSVRQYEDVDEYVDNMYFVE